MLHNYLKEWKSVSYSMAFTLHYTSTTVPRSYENVSIPEFQSTHYEPILKFENIIFYSFLEIFYMSFENLIYFSINYESFYTSSSLYHFHTFFSCFGPFLDILIPLITIFFMSFNKLIIQIFFLIPGLNASDHILLLWLVSLMQLTHWSILHSFRQISLRKVCATPIHFFVHFCFLLVLILI